MKPLKCVTMIRKRRNSSIEYRELNGRDVVIKKYQSAYNVSHEVDKLRRLKSLLSFQGDIRVIEVIHSNSDSIIMERVIHGDLRFLSGGKLDVLTTKLSILVEVLNKFESSGFHCDLDVSNILVDLNTGKLVIIDPLHYENELPHFSAVVLIIGLFKSMLLSPKWIYSLFTFQSKILKDYISNDREKCLELTKSIMFFLDKKIEWNKELVSKKYIERWLRVMLMIPMLYLLKFHMKIRLSRLW